MADKPLAMMRHCPCAGGRRVCVRLLCCVPGARADLGASGRRWRRVAGGGYRWRRRPIRLATHCIRSCCKAGWRWLAGWRRPVTWRGGATCSAPSVAPLAWFSWCLWPIHCSWRRRTAGCGRCSPVAWRFPRDPVEPVDHHLVYSFHALLVVLLVGGVGQTLAAVVCCHPCGAGRGASPDVAFVVAGTAFMRW